MQGLTRRQAEVLDVIRSHIADTGYPPTRADIASNWGSDPQTPRRST